MFEEIIKGTQRRLARLLLRPLFSLHFIRRRALALLNEYYDKGELTLRYRLPDHVIHLDPGDDVIAARVLLRGDWQRRDLLRVVQLLRRHVPQSEGKLFLDVGANIGTETLYAMLSGFFSGAVSVEPEPRNFALLSENLAANGLAQRVHAANCAAGAAPGRARLARSHSNKGGHALTAADPGGDSIEVEVMTIEAILQRAGRDPAAAGLVWIDVNGTEMQVLLGMPSLLRNRVPVVLEHLPDFITAEEGREIHRLLAAHYASYCRVDDVDLPPADIARFDAQKDTGDFLFF